MATMADLVKRGTAWGSIEEPSPRRLAAARYDAYLPHVMVVVVVVMVVVGEGRPPLRVSSQSSASGMALRNRTDGPSRHMRRMLVTWW